MPSSIPFFSVCTQSAADRCDTALLTKSAGRRALGIWAERRRQLDGPEKDEN